MLKRGGDAILTGTLFIVAAVTAIAGLLLYAPIMNNSEYVLSGPTEGIRITLGAVFELLTAVSVAGTSITLFPYLRRFSETRAVAYLAFRLLEAILIVIGLISMLSILTLRQHYEGDAAMDAVPVLVATKALLAIHDWTFILGPNFMLGISTLMYSSVLVQTTLVPRPLALLGVMAALSVFLAAILELFGVIFQLSAWGATLSLPVATFEIGFAIFLISKGISGDSLVDEEE